MGDDYTEPVTVLVYDDDGEHSKELKDINVWDQSETIKEMVKDTDPGDGIPLADDVTVDALDKVVEYMEKNGCLQSRRDIR